MNATAGAPAAAVTCPATASLPLMTMAVGDIETGRTKRHLQ
jgi:hypothetical protein